MSYPRTASAGNFTATVLSVASLNNLPGGVIDAKVVVANQTGITSVVDLTNLTSTVTPNSSRVIRVAYSLTVNSNTTGGDEFQILVLKDGTQISRLNFACSNAGNGTATGFVLDVGPTNASHVYKLQMGHSGGSSGTFSVQASATQPATLVVEDVGPQ